MATVLGYSNLIDSATLSGWTNNGNLKTRYLAQKATATGSLDIDLGSAQAIGLVALVSTAGVSSMTVTAGSSAGGSNLYSGTVSAYGGTDLALTFASVTARYWRITASGSVGRLFIGPRFSPAATIDWNPGLSYESATGVQSSFGGQEYFDERPVRRVWRGQWSWLTDAEAWGVVAPMLAASDISREVYLIEDDTDTSYRSLRRFLGRFRQLSAIEWPYVGTHTCGVEIGELL